jgi:Phosphotransferase enzyme family
MGEDSQKRFIENFFSALPGVTQSTCHQVAAQLLSPQGDIPMSIEPAPFQGSLSYSCVAPVPCGNHSQTIIQFRRKELKLDSTREAHAAHGFIVPPVTFQGCHHQLHVYTSPFIPGEPYINALMSSEGEPTLSHRLRTVTDLASVFVRLSTVDVPLPLDTLSVLSNLKLEIDFLVCAPITKQLIDRCVGTVLSNVGLIDSLPIVLAHPDLTPFNFLVEPGTGQVTAVIDWDEATYERVGHNLHFAEHLFGCMTLKGWMDYDDRNVVEERFRSELHALLSAQGWNDSKMFVFSLELSKALGLLQYHIRRMKNEDNKFWEGYLVSFLKQMSWENCHNDT